MILGFARFKNRFEKKKNIKNGLGQVMQTNIEKNMNKWLRISDAKHIENHQKSDQKWNQKP